MPAVPRLAQPGDIFVLLVPNGTELDRLRHAQKNLQAKYGGQLVEPIHITAERFTPEDGQDTEACIATLRQNLVRLRPFPIKADALIQFFAPYWQSQVLRWRVQETPEWSYFRDQLEATLSQNRCPSHFIRRRHATCTILKLNGEVDLSLEASKTLTPLFTAREFWISILRDEGQFEILETLNLNE